MEKNIVCGVCNAEFTEEEIEGASSCPGCGTLSIPYDRKLDIKADLNWQDCRILGNWAWNWAQHAFPEDMDSIQRLRNIFKKLNKVRPKNASGLILLDEVRDLNDKGIDCEVI